MNMNDYAWFTMIKENQISQSSQTRPWSTEITGYKTQNTNNFSQFFQIMLTRVRKTSPYQHTCSQSYLYGIPSSYYSRYK